MTNPSPPPPVGPGPADHDQQGPRTSRHEILELGRLRRTRDERRIAGVAGGLARHLDIDPTIVRVALVVLVFFGGAGLLLYAAIWLLAPEEGSPAQPLGLDDRNRNIALIGIGILAAIAAIGDFAGAFWFPWPLVILGLLVVWFLNRKEGRAAQPGWQSPPWPATEGPAQPNAPHQPYQPYQPYQQYGYVKPSSPRKRGPILFWYTLALIATGIGTLGIIDVAGTDLPGAAYPALAMTLTGAMLLLGAFWGRAGGLIFIGLIAAVATLGATASEHYEGKQLTYVPTTAAEVRASYNLEAGELILDLSRVQDIEGLDGRQLTVDGGIGDVEVVIPDGMDVSVDASTGIGGIDLFGQRSDGLDATQQYSLDGGTDVPDMRIIIDLGIGQVTVREQ